MGDFNMIWQLMRSLCSQSTLLKNPLIKRKLKVTMMNVLPLLSIVTTRNFFSL